MDAEAIGGGWLGGGAGAATLSGFNSAAIGPTTEKLESESAAPTASRGSAHGPGGANLARLAPSAAA